MATNSNKSIRNQLSKLYKLTFSGSTVDDVQKIKPAGQVKNKTNSNTKLQSVDQNFPSTIQLFLKDYYDKIKSSYISNESIEFQRLVEDIDDMILGEPRIARARDHYAAEIAQADSSDITIFVESKDKKQVEFIENYNLEFNIPDKLRDSIDNYATYGNDIWVISLSETGVSAVTPTQIQNLQQRYEFSPSNVSDFQTRNTSLNSSERMKAYLEGISGLKDFNYFETYLFGYEISGQLLPPWNVVHFRNKPYKSIFRPFGEPPLVGSLTPYKKYDIIHGLRAALLIASLPREKIGVNFAGSVHRTEIMEALVDLAARWQNTGLKKPAKEGMGISETLFYPSELMEIEYESPDLTLPDQADLEYAVEDIVVSTHLPRELLEEKDGWGNDSGSDIIEKSKFFYREIYKHQSSMLTTLTEHYKVAMILSGDFTLEEIDFTISLPYPEDMVSDDLVSRHSSMVRLATDVISTFQDTLTNREALPPEVVEMILKETLPFETNWIEDIIKIVLKSQTEQDLAEKFYNLKKAIDSSSERYKKSTLKVADIVESYYRNAAVQNDGKLSEAISRKRVLLTEEVLKENLYDIRKGKSDFKDYYSKGRHVVSSGKFTEYYVKAIDGMYDDGKKSTDFRDLKHLEEQEKTKTKKTKKSKKK